MCLVIGDDINLKGEIKKREQRISLQLCVKLLIDAFGCYTQVELAKLHLLPSITVMLCVCIRPIFRVLPDQAVW